MRCVHKVAVTFFGYLAWVIKGCIKDLPSILSKEITSVMRYISIRAGWEVMEKMGMVVPVREAMNLSRKDGMIPWLR